MCTASENDLKWLAVIMDRVSELLDGAGATGRNMNAGKAIAAGLITEEAFWTVVTEPVTVAEYEALMAREGIGGD